MSTTSTIQVVGGNTPFNSFKDNNNNTNISYIRANMTNNRNVVQNSLTLKFQNNSLTVDDDVKELPHRINVSSFSFTPIHNFVPQKQGLTFTNDEGKVTGFGQQRYIALSNGFNTNWFPENPTF